MLYEVAPYLLVGAISSVPYNSPGSSAVFGVVLSS